MIEDFSNPHSGAPRPLLAALTSSLKLETVLHRTLLALRTEGIPADGVFVNQFRAEARAIEFLAEASLERGRPMTDVVALTDALMRLRRTGTPDVRIVRSLDEDPFTAAVAPTRFPQMKSFVMLKLEIESQHLGIICFWSRRPGAFEARHARLLSGLATLFSLNVGLALSIRLRATNERLASENAALSRALAVGAADPVLAELIANTPSMASLADTLRRAGRFNAPVLVTGESGTGKEVIATAVHKLSSRRNAPFVRVNCSAIPEALMESEFFGHEAGAFTNALKRHAGYFEAADGGTLFLDEIGELPLSMQVKLLHALQNQAVRRVGGSEEIPVDVRIIAATNRNLEALVREKRFRLDLFYRLNVLPLHLRPLRERAVDLEPLIRLFVAEFTKAYGLGFTPEVSHGAIREAEGKYWPGNVRQLRNTVARTLMASPERLERIDHLAYTGDESAQQGGGALEAAAALPAVSLSAAEPLGEAAFAGLTFDEMQRRYFEALLSRTKGRISGEEGAAALCGLNPSTLRSRLQRLGFERFRNA